MRRIAVLAFLVVLAACSDATGPSGSVVGSYQLKTINGNPLPYSFSAYGGSSAVLESDVLTLNSDGTYSDVGQYSSAQGNTSITENGTWTNNNGSITFDDQTDGIEYQGSVSGTVLTEIVDNYTEVYQKR